MSISIFVLLNLINVVLGTLRSILTVKAKQSTAVIINTLSYTFYAGIVKLISGQSLVVVLLTTAITNIIGVFIATNLVKKILPNKLQVFDISIDNKMLGNFCLSLDFFKLQYSIFEIKNSQYTNIRLYSYSKRQSKQIHKTIENYNNFLKYNITECKDYK